MKKIRMIALVVLMIVGGGLALHLARAQQMAGVKRTDLQQHDLSIPGREVVQARIDIDPGYCTEPQTSRRRDHLCA